MVLLVEILAIKLSRRGRNKMNRRELLKNTAFLMGGLSSMSVANAFLAGVDGRAKIKSVLFTAKQRQVTAVLAEMIIPRTDTPGAIDAGVPHFIELMVSDWYTDREREIFFSGLQLVNDYCKDNYGNDFMESRQDNKVKSLEYAEEQSEKYKPPKSKSPLDNEDDESKPFFLKLKELTVLGYYTSEVGATKELNYNPMPMRYSDIDFVEVGRQWST